MAKSLKEFAVLLLLGLVSGCDSLHFIRGQAPEDGGCEITTTAEYTPPISQTQKVRGNFSISHVAGGPFPPPLDIVAYCNGTKVKELKNISPRQMGRDIELGKIAP